MDDETYFRSARQLSQAQFFDVLQRAFTALVREILESAADVRRK